jgi:hypothetical protein
MWDTAAAAAPGPFGVQLGLTAGFQVFGIGPAEYTWTALTGVKQVPLPLPNAPSLSGAVLYTQWLVLEPAGASPFAASNVLRIPLL